MFLAFAKIMTSR